MAIYSDTRLVRKGTRAIRTPLKGDSRPVGYDVPRDIVVSGTVDEGANVFEWLDSHNQYTALLDDTHRIT